ncbi:hypothetical protein CF319_g2836 [Tilletia indica]|uniref:Uncharacterized protein n=1 Tax=Tilletia walkeri TaxID=117179 RepID=A0A8X7N502_9BASI|nr:hypothetical protein CF327_g4487 [Tilletia walkeri]KAE8224260.1 hypothetical protein CF319_g2836 [Tilletia indica]KAE8267211.1 hypothetical protein A4X09_0g5136 [Tilletia walkeri]
MCVSQRDVELCRCCRTTIVEESTAEVHRCRLFADEDEDMHCMTLERSTNQYISTTITCSKCSNMSDDDDDDDSRRSSGSGYYRSGYSNGSSGDSSGDTSYSRRIGYSDESSSDDDSDSDDD